MKIKVKEKSLLAKIAARKLKVNSVAMVLGNTIYLWGAKKEDLLNSKSWLNHELKHVEQCLRYGLPCFLLLYLWETLRYGYYNNRFEREARAAEDTESVLLKFLR